MRLHDDDELYEVDQTYLGSAGALHRPMRHKAIFAWLVMGPLTFVDTHRLGLPLTVLTVGLLMLGTIWAAMTLADPRRVRNGRCRASSPRSGVT